MFGFKVPPYIAFWGNKNKTFCSITKQPILLLERMKIFVQSVLKAIYSYFNFLSVHTIYCKNSNVRNVHTKKIFIKPNKKKYKRNFYTKISRKISSQEWFPQKTEDNQLRKKYSDKRFFCLLWRIYAWCDW